MNAVISYSDFQHYMSYNDSTSEIIPIILIKPSVILNRRRLYRLDEVFDYFHHRTGEIITFFLPGYAQYPRFEAGELLSHYRPFDEKAIAFSYHHHGMEKNIYYNQEAFIDFINVIEEHSEGFRYYGNTELLLVKYVQEKIHSIGDIDFKSIHRYDLTQLFLSGGSEYRGYNIVESFLEDVYHGYRRFRRDLNEEVFFHSIDMFYDGILGARTSND